MLQATYVGNYVQVKEGPGKGKTFHLYNVTGTKEELKDYVNSPQFKSYPVRDKDGTPQFRTMYMDPLYDVLPLYKKQNGDYTLDGSESRKDISRMTALAGISKSLEEQFATRLVDKITGAPRVIVTAPKIAEPSSEATGEDTNMDEM